MKLLLSLFSCLMLLSLQGQRAGSRVDKTEIEIGIPARLLIEVQQDQDAFELEFVPFRVQDSLSPGLEILSVTYDTIDDKPYPIYRQTIGFTAWEKGLYEVHSVPVIIDKDIFSTKPFMITVTEPKEPEELHDIKDIVYVDKTFWDYMKASIPYLIFLIVLAGIAYIIWKKRQKEKEKAIIIPTTFEDLQTQTIQKFKELEAENRIQKGEVKSFYSDYSDLWKSFIQERFGIPAKDLFTSDILYLLENKHVFSDPQMRQLKNLLQRADLAKFAKIVPSESQGKEDILSAIEIIQSLPVQSINQHHGNT